MNHLSTLTLGCVIGLSHFSPVYLAFRLLDGLAPGRSFPLTFFFRVLAVGNNYRRFIPSRISSIAVGESESSAGELWRRAHRGILIWCFKFTCAEAAMPSCVHWSDILTRSAPVGLTSVVTPRC